MQHVKHPNNVEPFFSLAIDTFTCPASVGAGASAMGTE
jgi:hypothetical protein